MVEYLEVEEARDRPGLRLVLTAGVPGPWGESAKSLFDVKGVPYLRVRQLGGLPNEALLAWTGHENAPVAVYEQERPRAAWTDILFLAERIAPEPSLVPSADAERARMFGLAHEICGELGFGWSRRLMMLEEMLAAGGGDSPMRPVAETLAARYGYTPGCGDAARARVRGILELLSAVLREQHARGSRYFVGASFSALDLYWAAFAALYDPLPHDVCPMAEPLRVAYTLRDADVRKGADPLLLEHRDLIYERHLSLPLDF